MKPIAIYLRVSSSSQTEASQRLAVSKWLDSHGIESDFAHWYVDVESGDTIKRPAFDQLQKDVFDGAVTTIVVFKLDRISRKLRDGINTICDWCERGIRVVSVTQQLDFSGPTGRLIAAVLFAVAEMEQETRRERQAVGIEAAKKRGVYKGRKPGSTKANPRRALALRAKGLTIREIATALGVSMDSVKRYIRQLGGVPPVRLENHDPYERLRR